MFEWDEDKRQANLTKHGVDFTAIAGFDWDTAIVRSDTRSNYGEERLVAYGMIGERLFFCAWTRRAGRVRIISLRKANPREIWAYGTEAKLH